jgi:hypothetical protein
VPQSAVAVSGCGCSAVTTALPFNVKADQPYQRPLPFRAGPAVPWGLFLSQCNQLLMICSEQHAVHQKLPSPVTLLPAGG